MRLTMSSRCQTFKHHIINLIEKEEKKKRKLQGLTKQGHMRMNTLTHENRGKDGGTAGSTRAFLGAAQASRKPAERKLWRTTEEKRSVTVRQHFILANARSPFSHRLPLFYSSSIGESRSTFHSSPIGSSSASGCSSSLSMSPRSGSSSCRFLNALILFPATGIAILVPSSSARWYVPLSLAPVTT